MARRPPLGINWLYVVCTSELACVPLFVHPVLRSAGARSHAFKYPSSARHIICVISRVCFAFQHLRGFIFLHHLLHLSAGVLPPNMPSCNVTPAVVYHSAKMSTVAAQEAAAPFYSRHARRSTLYTARAICVRSTHSSHFSNHRKQNRGYCN